MPQHLGKLIRTLKDRCPQCGWLLQLRYTEELGEFLDDGAQVANRIEVIVCSHHVLCDYTAKPKKAHAAFARS